jgi:hypothetical protein
LAGGAENAPTGLANSRAPSHVARGGVGTTGIGKKKHGLVFIIALVVFCCVCGRGRFVLPALGIIQYGSSWVLEAVDRSQDSRRSTRSGGRKISLASGYSIFFVHVVFFFFCFVVVVVVVVLVVLSARRLVAVSFDGGGGGTLVR